METSAYFAEHLCQIIFIHSVVQMIHGEQKHSQDVGSTMEELKHTYYRHKIKINMHVKPLYGLTNKRNIVSERV